MDSEMEASVSASEASASVSTCSNDSSVKPPSRREDLHLFDTDGSESDDNSSFTYTTTSSGVKTSSTTSTNVKRIAIPRRLKQMLERLQSGEEKMCEELVDKLIEFMGSKHRNSARLLQPVTTLLHVCNVLCTYALKVDDRAAYLNVCEVLTYMAQRVPESAPLLARFGLAEFARDKLINVTNDDDAVIERSVDIVSVLTEDDYDAKARVGTRAMCARLASLMRIHATNVGLLHKIVKTVRSLSKLAMNADFLRDAQLEEVLAQLLVELNLLKQESSRDDSIGEEETTPSELPIVINQQNTALKELLLCCLECVCVLARGAYKSRVTFANSQLCEHLADIMRRWSTDVSLQVACCETIVALAPAETDDRDDKVTEPDPCMANMFQQLEASGALQAVAQAIHFRPTDRSLFVNGFKAVISLCPVKVTKDTLLSSMLISPLVSGMRLFQVDRDMQLVGLSVVVHILRNGLASSAILELLDKGICKVIQKAIHTWARDRQVLMKVFDAIQALSFEKGALTRLGEEGLCQSMVDQLRMQTNIDLQCKVLATIHRLMFNHIDNNRLLANARIVQALRQLVVRKVPPPLSSLVCDIVWALCLESENRAKLGREGFCDVVVGILSENDTDSNIVAKALSAAYHMCAFTPDNQRKFGEAGCCEHVQKALLSFPDNIIVVEKCLTVFHVLAFDGMNRTLLGKIEAYDLVISAIDQYVNIREIQRRGMCCIWTMALNHPTNRKKIGDSGGCKTVIQSLSRFKHDLKIVRASISALLHLSLHSGNQDRLISYSGLINLLVEIIRTEIRYLKEDSLSEKDVLERGTYDILEIVTQTLVSIAWENPDGLAVLVTCGVPEICVEVLETVQVGRVQAAVLSLIAQIALHALTRPLLLHKGVALLLEQTFKHGREHREIIERACVCVSRLCSDPQGPLEFSRTNIATQLVLCLEYFKQDQSASLLVLNAARDCAQSQPRQHEVLSAAGLCNTINYLVSKSPDDEELSCAALETLLVLASGQNKVVIERVVLALEASDFGLLKLVLRRSQIYLPKDVQIALELVKALSSGGGAIALGRGGVPTAVISALSDEELLPNLREIGWSTLAELLLDRENVETLGEAGACEILEKYLRSQSQSMALLKVLCTTLARLCSTEANRNKFHNLRIQEDLVLLLEKHSHNTTFVCVALKAVDALACSTHLKLFFGRRVIPLICEMMGGSSSLPNSSISDSSVVAVFLGTLDRLSRDSGVKAQLLIDADLLSCVVSSCELHPNHREVQHCGCVLLTTLARLQPANEDMCEQSVPVLVSVFAHFGHAVEVLRVAIEAVHLLSVGSNNNRRLMVDERVHESIYDAMVRFPADIALQSFCCAALWEFAEAAVNRSQLLKIGLLELVYHTATTLGAAHEDIQLQYYAYGATRALTKDNDALISAEMHTWLAECEQKLHIGRDEANSLRSTQNYQHFLAQRMSLFDSYSYMVRSLGCTRSGDGRGCLWR